MERFHQLQQFRKRSRANTDVNRFFTQVEQLRILIQDLQSWVEKLKTKQAEILAVPICNDNRSQQLEEINHKINSLSQTIRTKLKGFEKTIHAAERKSSIRSSISVSITIPEEGQGQSSSSQDAPTSTSVYYCPATLRIKKTQFATLVKEFSEIITSYQLSQVNYRDQLKSRLKRQLEITNNESVTDDQIDSMIDSGKVTVFTKSIIFDTKIIEDIQSRHNDLMNLEKSIRDLNDLFKELATLVQLQGYTIDSIEESIAKTLEFTEDARRELRKAEKHTDIFRKRKVCLITSFGVGVTIIIVIIVLALSLSFHS